MIDIATENERNLKDIRQIGTPSDEDRIYIENSVYKRVREEDFAQRRVFVFMGHTECEQGKYTTFVEAAIPVRSIEFVQNVPRWNTHAWSDIFREIKRSYENLIIVGWALDIKGFAPRVTEELEAVHREQFGGAHQVLFLMDSIEGEEYFYINRGNCLQQKNGFYIYYGRRQTVCEPEVTVELPRDGIPARTTSDQAQNFVDETTDTGKPRYREVMQREEEKKKGFGASSYAMTAAIVLLIAIVGLGVYQDRIKLSGLEEAVSTMGAAVSTMGEHLEKIKNAQKDTSSEVSGLQAGVSSALTENTGSEELKLVPVTEVPLDEVGIDDENSSEPQGELIQQTDEEAGDRAESSDRAGTSDKETSAPAVQEYIVRPGDTLTGICKKLYGSSENIQALAELNQLEDVDDIRTGQKLLLP